MEWYKTSCIPVSKAEIYLYQMRKSLQSTKPQQNNNTPKAERNRGKLLAACNGMHARPLRTPTPTATTPLTTTTPMTTTASALALALAGQRNGDKQSGTTMETARQRISSHWNTHRNRYSHNMDAWGR